MAKILPITPTLLSTYLTCPRQYQAKYITKEVVFKQNEQAIYGSEGHKAFELALKNDTPLPEKFKYLQKPVNWCKKRAAQPGVIMEVEKSLAITRDFKPTTWNSKDVWLRGKADVFFNMRNQKENIIIDWKFGKPWDDPTQAHILSLCAKAASGNTNTTCLWFYVKKPTYKESKLDLTDITPVEVTLANVARYERACREDDFPTNQNGLCRKYCDVLSCPFNGRN